METFDCSYSSHVLPTDVDMVQPNLQAVIGHFFLQVLK